VERIQIDHLSLKEFWSLMVLRLLGLMIMASILLGMGPTPIAMAATSVTTPKVPISTVSAPAVPTVTVETAIDQYLSSMPGDYYAVGTVSALKNLIAQSNPLLVDVRTPSEYNSGHIPKAINVPLNDLTHHLDSIPADQETVLYCSMGYRSAMGVMALRLQGFDQVRGFPPSFAGWQAADEPVSRSGSSGKAQA
jgi:rhodanese-related sulfurtransferase